MPIPTGFAVAINAMCLIVQCLATGPSYSAKVFIVNLVGAVLVTDITFMVKYGIVLVTCSDIDPMICRILTSVREVGEISEVVAIGLLTVERYRSVKSLAEPDPDSQKARYFVTFGIYYLLMLSFEMAINSPHTASFSFCYVERDTQNNALETLKLALLSIEEAVPIACVFAFIKIRSMNERYLVDYELRKQSLSIDERVQISANANFTLVMCWVAGALSVKIAASLLSHIATAIWCEADLCWILGHAALAGLGDLVFSLTVPVIFCIRYRPAAAVVKRLLGKKSESIDMGRSGSVAEGEERAQRLEEMWKKNQRTFTVRA